jgi:hypothetical protein
VIEIGRRRRRATRLTAPVAALALLACAACGSSPKTGAHGTTGAPGALSVGPQSAAGAGHGAPVTAPPDGAPGTGGTGGGTAAGSAPGTGPSSASGGSSGSSSGADPVAGAEQALTAYLGGISRHEAATVLATSEGAPAGLAGVLLDVAAIDAERGATTTVTMGPAHFTVSGTPSASVVTLVGSLTITTTVSGPKGSGSSTDTLSGPVTVRDEQGAWKVAAAAYDGKPLVEWQEDTGQTVGGLAVQVGYVVSYGNVTAALVTLYSASGSQSVSFQAASLVTTAGNESGVADFTTTGNPTGVVRFARTDARPSELDMSFKNASGQTVVFVIDLPGQAG